MKKNKENMMILNFKNWQMQRLIFGLKKLREKIGFDKNNWKMKKEQKN